MGKPTTDPTEASSAGEDVPGAAPLTRPQPEPPELEAPESERGAEYRRYLSTALLEMSKAYGSAVLIVAGAALSLSVTLFTRPTVPGTPSWQYKGFLIAAWVALGLAMALEVLALLTSMRGVRSAAGGDDKDGTWWFKWTEGLNWIIAGALIGGIVLLMLFAGANL